MVNASSSSEFTTQIVIILGCFWNYPLTPQGRHAWQICHTIAVVLIFQLPDKNHRNPVSLAHRYNHKMKHTARNQSVEALLFVLLSGLEFLVYVSSPRTVEKKFPLGLGKFFGALDFF